MILSIVNSEKYRDLPPNKIIPMLADEEEYIASESSFYRILREEKQLIHRGKSKPAKHKRPDECVATAPNQLWCWDISYLPGPVRGEYFYLYMIIDVFSRKIVGWSIHDTQSDKYASYLIKQACIDEGVDRNQVTLHSDNGSPMKGLTMLTMLQALGITPSFSRPSVSDDNPFSEALFRTVKYHSSFPMSSAFASITEARKWCIAFVCWYNRTHLHSGLKFITPEQRHTGQDEAIMKKRHQVYLSAKQRRPDRWSGNTRNWMLPTELKLNPDKKNRHALCQQHNSYQQVAA